MTERPGSSEIKDVPPHSDAHCAPKSILILNATHPQGEALCMAFARKGARLVLQHSTGDEEALPIAARAARRGAIVLPLERDIGAAPEGWQAELIERVVGDFGRLDLVIAPLSGDIASQSASLGALARAASPHLRRADPVGRFVVLLPPASSESVAREFAETLVEAGAGKRKRPIIQVVLLNADERPDPPAPEQAARFVVEICECSSVEKGALRCSHT